jgi:hypothetical protein
MYQKQKLHAGLQQLCKVCTPNQKLKRRNYEDRPKVERRATTLDGVLRRQLAEEIGDVDLSKDQRFVMLQKLGMAQVRIDRKVTKPSWKDKKTWRTEQNEWFRATKGLVPAIQFKTDQPKNYRPRISNMVAVTESTPPPLQLRHFNQIGFQRKRQGRNNSRPNPSLNHSSEN